MSTLAEIEAAVATLQPQEMERLEIILHELQERAREERLQELYKLTGFHPLPRRDNRMITNEMVNRIREDEGL